MGLLNFLFRKNGEHFQLYPDNDWNRYRYKNGKYHGVCEFGHNFKTSGQMTYKNGKKDGKTLYLFPDGDTYKEMHYKDDVLEGPYKIWNEQKALVTYGEHRNGVRHGCWQEITDDGSVKLESKYDMGRLVKVTVWNNIKAEKESN
jgi:antitoxin component YwqK of YwqJK toxin-antitoxin module